MAKDKLGSISAKSWLLLRLSYRSLWKVVQHISNKSDRRIGFLVEKVLSTGKASLSSCLLLVCLGRVLLLVLDETK